MADSRLRSDNAGARKSTDPKTTKAAPAEDAYDQDQLEEAADTGVLRGSDRGDDEGRESRASIDRALTESRELTEDERLEMFRQSFARDVLPDLPTIPGFHVCWLTTTNPRDPIARRVRLGYEPVRPEDVPGWEFATLKTGEYAGLIGVNEMLAFKLPVRLYEAFMQEAHHDAPLREQQKLTSTVDAIREQAQQVKGDVIEEEGFAELRKPVRRPRFATDAELGTKL